MADTSRESLKYLGLSTFDIAGCATHYILIYNNINKQQKAWHQRLSCQDCVQSGTSATIVMLQNMPDEAFNPTICYDLHKQEWERDAAEPHWGRLGQ